MPFLGEEQYALEDEAFDNKFGCDIRKTINKKGREKLFEVSIIDHVEINVHTKPQLSITSHQKLIRAVLFIRAVYFTSHQVFFLLGRN